MNIKPGMRLVSGTCDTEVVVVRGNGEIEISCGGLPMSEDAVAEKSAPAAGFDEGSVLGKRYEDAGAGVELLCVRPGSGSLSVGGRVLEIKAAKALPSSD